MHRILWLLVKGVNKINGLIDVHNMPIKDIVKMAPSSKQNKTKVIPSTKVLVKVKHKNLITLINKVAIFYLRKLLANIDGMPAAKE